MTLGRPPVLELEANAAACQIPRNFFFAGNGNFESCYLTKKS